MVLLGFIADDLIGTERIELRTIAYAWFLDCSRHNDLHRIIRVLYYNATTLLWNKIDTTEFPPREARSQYKPLSNTSHL